MTGAFGYASEDGIRWTPVGKVESEELTVSDGGYPMPSLADDVSGTISFSMSWWCDAARLVSGKLFPGLPCRGPRYVVPKLRRNGKSHIGKQCKYKRKICKKSSSPATVVDASWTATVNDTSSLSLRYQLIGEKTEYDLTFVRFAQQS